MIKLVQVLLHNEIIEELVDKVYQHETIFEQF
jgi:hypothetical protein